MIRYAELVQYIKDNHINWNKDLFDVLKGFFEDREKSKVITSLSPSPSSLFNTKEFKEPETEEYTTEDVFNLLST